MHLSEKVNKKNCLVILVIPILYWLLKDFKVLQGFILGIISICLFREVQLYGIKALILKPDSQIVD